MKRTQYNENYRFWSFQFSLKVNMEEGKQKMMQWSPHRWQRDFNFVMITTHPCANSNLCMSPLFQRCTGLPRVSCLETNDNQDFGDKRYQATISIGPYLQLLTSRGCLRISASSFRSSIRMNRFLFRLKVTVNGYT